MVVHEEFDVQIPSDTAEGHAIQERILKVLEDVEYSPRDVFSVRLALEEALVNAIKHGNGMAPDKQVRVECKVTPEEVWVRITDEGAGFNPDEVADPTDDDNLEIPGGRGIMLMRAFMSLIQYNEIGNQITLVKKRDEPQTDEAD